MNRGFSLYLDALRAVAAMTVAFSHFAYARFTGGLYEWFRDYNFGSDAVIVFFVMSGLLIAYAAENSDGAASYAKARFARLYSVALPAIVLTLALDAIGRQWDPLLYQPPWDRDDAVLSEILRAVTFTNEIWFWGSRLGTNGPYWSLAYEAWYYALFAVFIFSKSPWRWGLLILGAMVVGPRVLLLAPCWIAGVVFFRLVMLKPAKPLSRRPAFAFSLLPIVGYAALQATSAPDALYEVTRDITGLNEPALLLGFSNEFLWNYLLTGLILTHLRGVIALAGFFPELSSAAKQVIRWPAQRSFALYLFHYPLLSCLTAVSPFERASLLHHAMLAGATLAICFILAEATERRLPFWRKLIDGIGQPRRITPARPRIRQASKSSVTT